MENITKVEAEKIRELDPQVLDKLLTGSVRILMGFLGDHGYEDYTHNVETAVRNYLNTQKIGGNVVVTFMEESYMPGKNLQKTFMLTKEDDVCLELETRVYESRSPDHILYACVQKNKEVMKAIEERKRWEKFCQKFSDNRDVGALLNEARSKLDINKPVFVRQVPKKWWFSEYEREVKPVVFLGQMPNLKTRSFVPNRPIGYVVDNKVCVAVSCKAFKEEKFII